ncbi:hypothetical protein CPA57_02040 [Bombella sp. TMW2.1880]|uniref:Transglycosylase SLT domain-containing protein n=1 Tax=Bombella favorum TaxID=2039164 RepID=A0ABR5ZL60_9PROT|nr:hypothetical protein [Bombella favorum]
MISASQLPINPPERSHRIAATVLMAALLFCSTTSAWGDTARSLEDELGVSTTSHPSSSLSRLTEWKALTAPNGAAYPAQRYAEFLRQQPAWPLQKRIESRYEHALLADNSVQTRQNLCSAFPIARSDLLTACASYLSDVPSQARRLWRETDMPSGETALFLSRFSSYLTPADDLKRYERLERTGPVSLARQQLQRTAPALRPVLTARLANRFATAEADAAFQNSASSNDAMLLYYRVKYLRIHNRLDEATRLWQQTPPKTSTGNLSVPTTAEWQDERTSFVRALLRTDRGDAAQTGFALLNSLPTAEQTPDSHLMAGYIALTLLHAPNQAIPHFRALAEETDLSHRATGLYWLARSMESQHPDQATSFYKKAAALPTTFYGQMALARRTHTALLSTTTRDGRFLAPFKQQLAALPPIPTGNKRLPRPDLVDAATQLQQAGDRKNATLFLSYLLGRTQNDKTVQPTIARLAVTLSLPKPSILAARQLARQGIAFYPGGYPSPSVIFPTSLPRSLIPALIRQESSMDEQAISPRHAFGLTQLLLPTAIQTVKRHSLPYHLTSPADLLDPNINTILGSLFMEDLHNRFGQVLPYTLAAYNAGPGRSKQWQEQMNSPTSPTLADEDNLLRWILLIPYKETRLYIEHIVTDMSLYTVLLEH